MKDGLQAANRLFIAVLVGCGLGLLLCFPHLDDGRRVGALRTLEALETQLDVAGVETGMLREAEAKAAPSLKAIATAAEGPGVQGLASAKGAPTLFHAVPLGLHSLADVVDKAANGSELVVTGPDIEAVALALRWRIGNAGGAASTKLTGLRTAKGSASEAQLATELQAEPARLSAITTRRAFEKDRKRFLLTRDRAKRVRENGASRKVQWKANLARRDAYNAMEASKLVMESSREAYHRAVAAAGGFNTGKAGKNAKGVLVVASLEREGEDSVEWLLPVPSVRRTIQASPVSLPLGLAELQQGAHWEELKELTVTEARVQVQDSLSWHMLGTNVGPIRVGGATVLHLFPLVLIALLFALARKCRTITEGFSPFNHPGAVLPKVGTGRAAVDRALLVAPGCIVALVALWALWRIDAQAWLGLPFWGGAIAYAASVAKDWVGLTELRTYVIRSSVVPPPPSEE